MTRLTSFTSAETRYSPFIWMLLSRTGSSRLDCASISFIYEPSRKSLTKGERSFRSPRDKVLGMRTEHSRIPYWLAR